MVRIVPGMRELLFGADAGGSGRDIKAADGAVTGTPSDAGSRTTGRKLIMSDSPPAKGATGSMTSRWSAEKTGRPSWKNASRIKFFLNSSGVSGHAYKKWEGETELQPILVQNLM